MTHPSFSFAIGVLGLAVGAGACADGGSQASASTPPSERATAVAAAPVVTRDLSLRLNVSGTVEPLYEVRIAARMAGIVHDVRVEEGRRVAPGDVLAHFDVSEQEAELARARTLFEQAEAVLARAREMQRRGLISDAEVDQLKSDEAVAKSGADLWDTRVALGTVRSPRAGVVVAKSVEAGDAVSNGAPLFVVADLDALVVRVGITDIHAARLLVGQSVQVTADALPGRTWPGRIRRIFPTADRDSRLHTVEFELGHAAGRERPVPGYLVRVDLNVDQRTDVLAVPNQALLTTSDGMSVFVIDGDRLARRDVVAGVSRNNWTEIVSGLEAGDLVVSSSPANLRDGMLVRTTEERVSAQEAS
jgi:membrane fusion protein, multidrug efflux system